MLSSSVNCLSIDALTCRRVVHPALKGGLQGFNCRIFVDFRRRRNYSLYVLAWDYLAVKQHFRVGDRALWQQQRGQKDDYRSPFLQLVLGLRLRVQESPLLVPNQCQAARGWDDH